MFRPSMPSSRSPAQWSCYLKLLMPCRSNSMDDAEDGCSRAIVMGISPHDRSKTFSMPLRPELACRRSNARIKAGKNRHRVHPHLLRHSFAVWSLDSGVPVGDLQDQLGHASLATTGIYLKVSPNHRRESYLRSSLSDRLAGEKP
jgi:integrase